MTIFTRVSLLPDATSPFAESPESCVNCLSPSGHSRACSPCYLPGRPSARRPGHPPATEHVRVHVLNCLPSLLAGIEDNPVTRPVDSGRRGDLVRQRRDLVQQPRARLGERGEIGIMI